MSHGQVITTDDLLKALIKAYGQLVSCTVWLKKSNRMPEALDTLKTVKEIEQVILKAKGEA